MAGDDRDTGASTTDRANAETARQTAAKATKQAKKKTPTKKTATRAKGASKRSATLGFSRQKLLTAVKRSPQAVADKDRDAWLAVFAEYNLVEDPVGSEPHLSGVFDRTTGNRGKGPLERFYETFIAPNEITFHVSRNIICDDHVVRDLIIEIDMGRGVTVEVPMHLLYEMVAEQGEPRIRRLAAHWELWPMLRQLAAQGRSALPLMNALGWRMLRQQGLSGMLGFSRALMGVGEEGRDRVHAFVGALNTQQSGQMVELFDPDNRGVHFPYGERHFTPADLASTVDATMTIAKVLVSGYTVSASIELELDGRKRQGVGLFEFNTRTKRLREVRLYWEA